MTWYNAIIRIIKFDVAQKVFGMCTIRMDDNKKLLGYGMCGDKYMW